MATKIVMEALSPTMEEGRLVEWKKNEGDPVAAGDVLAEVETDKAVMELVARGAGTLLKQVVAAGSTVPVSDIVGWIGEPGENIDGGSSAAEAPKDKDSKAAAKPAKQAETKEPDAEQEEAPKAAATKAAAPAEPEAPAQASGGRIKASPLARKIAAEKGVDLARVSGSGPEGRVIKRDLDGVSAAPAGAAPARSLRQADKPAGPPFVDVPLSQIRKTIAKRLALSIGPIPTFYLTSEIDMERAADLREQLKGAYGDSAKVSFNDLVIRATALALRAHPAVNAWWQDDHIRQWNEIHIGMAVAIPDGLITPIIRNADEKSLLEIGAEAKALAGRARARKLQPDEYTGATFSISNLGMFDIEHFTAVINPPEAGILAIGSIATIPAVVNGAIVPRKRMRITMSCDHRVIDGATGAEFLKTLKQLLENPVALIW